MSPVVAATAREGGEQCGGKAEEGGGSMLLNNALSREGGGRGRGMGENLPLSGEGGGRGGGMGDNLPSSPNNVYCCLPMTKTKFTGGVTKTKFTGGKKRPFISIYRPCDKVTRDNMKYDKNPSMYAYLKLPHSCPKNPPMVAAAAPVTSVFTTTSTAASATITATSARGKYRCKTNDWGASAEWISIMLSTNDDKKQANEALLMHHPTVFISWSTLNSRLNSASAKANLDASGDLGVHLDLFECTKDVSSAGLTSKEDRELLQTIAMQRGERNQGMTRKGTIVLISELGGVSIKHT